ncbi:MAG: hypothetical protein J6C46_11315 [Clostridia bacterium]|nr:hypothetical protein [Clostridia bacterium]
MKNNPLSEFDKTRVAKIQNIFKIVEIITWIIGIALGSLICVFSIRTDFKDEEITQFKEVISYAWENGLQREYERFTIVKNDKNVNLYNLTNMPIKAPENADIEFMFNINEYRVHRKGSQFIIKDNIGVRNIIFNVADNEMNVNVSYMASVIFGIFICMFVCVILFCIDFLIGSIIAAIFTIMKKKKQKRIEI